MYKRATRTALPDSSSGGEDKAGCHGRTLVVDDLKEPVFLKSFLVQVKNG
jgi:hypothetical protein